MDWNKDSVSDTNFAKTNLLSLPVLDHLDEVLNLIERREGARPDLSPAGTDGLAVYGMTAAQADEVRCAFARPNNAHLIAMHRRRFLDGAGQRGAGGRGGADIRQDKRAVYVPRKPLPCLRGDRVQAARGCRQKSLVQIWLP